MSNINNDLLDFIVNFTSVFYANEIAVVCAILIELDKNQVSIWKEKQFRPSLESDSEVSYLSKGKGDSGVD